MNNYEELKNVLKKNGTVINEHEGGFAFNFKSGSGVLIIQIQPEEETNAIFVLGYHCCEIPLELQPKILEYLNIINNNIICGSFYVIAEDGLYFRHFVAPQKDEQDLLAEAIGYPIRILEVHASGVMDIIYSNATAKEAFEKAQLEAAARFGEEGGDIAES